eukprot:CAMPEP_0184861542 /NCGR_PEP_ID=MMETSP0580-20130426/6203_1 /TAXON_ID=1118495 /ORGANISM="Dactyliosolen fragilissimus" /LENGTH=139 /DNA_ID=CAMNT_0027359073 /DNA_START=130 /DNA_END=549 /DNA_ORIENTATION=+
MAPLSPKSYSAQTSTSLKVMSAEEIDTLMARGHQCEESECSIDDVDNLIIALKDQKSSLYKRIQEVDKMVTSLEILNQGGDDRKVDEINETVKAIFRLFSLEPKADPTLHRASGYSGEVGKGPTDAYKALNPKVWKAAP